MVGWWGCQELLLVQAFPVKQHSVKHLCSFNIDRSRRRTAIGNQAGNSMAVPCVGAMQAFAGVCLTPDDAEQPSRTLLSTLLRRKLRRLSSTEFA